MKLRAASGRDAHALTTFPRTPSPQPWVAAHETWARNHAWRWAREAAGAQLFVGLDDGDLIGAVGIEPWIDRLEPLDNAWFVRGPIVAYDRRHRGHGTALLNAALTTIWSNGGLLAFWRFDNDDVVALELSMKCGATIAGSSGNHIVCSATRQP